MSELFNNIYKGKKVLVTGHTGFKGSWLCLWLSMLGADVCGYSLKPKTNPSMFSVINLENIINKSSYGNILNIKLLNKTIQDFKPDIIFHLAAQALVRDSYKYPINTYKTNVIGTLNLLEAARNCSNVRAFVNITSDKCYENKEITKQYSEQDELGGYDMYSSSKACSEILTSSYRRSFLNEGFLLASARAGNVIGGGDWAKDRLIPDCIKSINSNKNIVLRNPGAIRPWQFVLEPLSGYLSLGQKLLKKEVKYAQAFNFGPMDKNLLNVKDVTKKIIKIYGQGKMDISYDSCLHEAQILILNAEKSQKELNWSATYDINKALVETVNWYKNFYQNKTDMLEFSKEQILSYIKEIKWNKN